MGNFLILVFFFFFLEMNIYVLFSVFLYPIYDFSLKNFYDAYCFSFMDFKNMFFLSGPITVKRGKKR